MGILNTIHQIRKELRVYIQHLAVYTKYQLITKGILFLVLLPLFYKIANALIKSSGQMVLSSGNYKEFLFSTQGIVFVIAAVLFFTATIGIDINVFIAISSSIKKEGKPIGIVAALKESCLSLKNMASPAGIFLLVFTILLAPLAGFGLKTSIVKSLKIPNFITSVIYQNGMYLTLYIIVLTALAVIGFFLLLSFHYMFLHHEKSIDAVKSSFKTVWANKVAMFRSFIILNGGLFLALAVFVVAAYWLIEFLNKGSLDNTLLSRFLMLVVLFAFTEFVNLWFFLIGPLQIHMMTSRFYASATPKGNDTTPVAIPETPAVDPVKQQRAKRNIRRVLCALLIFNILASGLTAVFFDELFRYRPDVNIVAHRGGGNLGAENTLVGLEAAIRAGAEWSEIDIMRSKDGVYIVNHDTDFSRLTDSDKKLSEMTWKEIQKLKVKDTFNSKRAAGTVADLDTMMNASKGKIGLFIELKGEDADTKMADDVVAAIRQKKMEKEAVIISLDYKLIQYIEEKYPSIDTGYLYFFSFGDTSKIKTDYLIMEESGVNLDMIEKIHQEGKGAFVWTVNNPDAIGNLLDADIDGIVTDDIIGIQKGIKKWDKKTDKDIIFDEIEHLIKKS